MVASIASGAANVSAAAAAVIALLLTHYRPFYVAAKLIEQRQAAQALSKAGDIVFTNLAVPIASLMALQAAYDAANALVLPAGFEAVPPATGRRFRSVAIQRISVP